MCLTSKPISTGTPTPTTPVHDDISSSGHSSLGGLQATEPQQQPVENVLSPTQPASTSQPQLVATVPLAKPVHKGASGHLSTSALESWKNDIKNDKPLQGDVDKIWKGLSLSEHIVKLKGADPTGSPLYRFGFGALDAARAFAAQNPGLKLQSKAVDCVSDLIAKHAVHHSDVHSSFEQLGGASPKAFKDWFHSLAATVSLLGSRAYDKPDSRLSEERQQQLLKTELMRGQLQATYAQIDADRLDRSRSPLVVEGYGRGVKTGLWLAAAAVVTDQIRGAHASNKATLTRFEVFPVNHAFSYGGHAPTIVDDASAGLPDKNCVYIKSLGVQLIRKDTSDLAKIHTFLGGRGLRSSPSECADICAAQMVRKISKGDIPGALQTLDRAYTGGDAKLVRTQLAKTELMPNTLIAPFGADPLTQSTPDQLRELAQVYTACVDADTAGLPFYLTQNLQVVRNLIGDMDAFTGVSMPAVTCGALTEALQTVSELLSQARFLMASPQDRLREVQDEHMAVTQQLSTLVARNRHPGNESDIILGGLARGIQEDMTTLAFHHSNLQVLPPALSLHMERFYQAMQDIHHAVRFQSDWTGRAPSLDDAIAGLLLDRPEAPSVGLSRDEANLLAPFMKVERAPHALAMLDQISASLSLSEDASVVCLHGAYYETPHLFVKPVEVDTVTAPKLLDADVIVMEPHPNNAAEVRVQAHDPVALINHLFSGTPDRARTLVMDVTLNHLGEDQISQALQAAAPHIESGKLNLVLLQSGTKFFQNGMDLVNIGTAAIFNNATHWQDFRTAMEQNRMNVPMDDQGYIASMLSPGNQASSMAYLEKVRANTATLRTALESRIPLDHTLENAYETCVNTDGKTVYVAFKPTDAYVARRLGKEQGATLSDDERSKVNVEEYESRFRPIFGDMATVDRSSFGFNITNFGECVTTVRITLGIEEPDLLQVYADRIVALGSDLYKEAFSTT